jgi:hypothetical protein
MWEDQVDCSDLESGRLVQHSRRRLFPPVSTRVHTAEYGIQPVSCAAVEHASFFNGMVTGPVQKRAYTSRPMQNCTAQIHSAAAAAMPVGGWLRRAVQTERSEFVGFKLLMHPCMHLSSQEISVDCR